VAETAVLIDERWLMYLFLREPGSAKALLRSGCATGEKVNVESSLMDTPTWPA
jgi:hypothetical protein